jgi:maleylacetoacetate isomerase
MRLRLYSNSYNSAGERVRIAMALKGIKYEYISIKTIGWEAYRSINPQALLPTLVVEDVLFTQSTAILEYLEETYPEPPLLPLDPILRTQARGFGQAIASEMHAIDVGRVRRFLGDELAVLKPDLERWSAHWMHDGFTALESLLARREIRWPYCYGDEPGWADLFLVPQVRKGVSRFDLDLNRYPCISEIFRRCEVLPAFVAASPEQQSDYEGSVGKGWRPEEFEPR